MDSNHLLCIFYKDSCTKHIFQGMFAKDQFMKEHFKNETYMCVVNEQDFRFPGSHWVFVYQNKKKMHFLDFHESDFAYRLVCQVSRGLQGLDTKLCEAYPLVFGRSLARGLDMNSITDYFTWDRRLNNEFIYNYDK